MHPECYELMKAFAESVKPGSTVADIGSRDVNGTCKPLFPGCEYTGLDIRAGKNVDRVVLPYFFGKWQHDVVISSNTLEHVEDTHRWTAALLAICKPGGLFCVIVPHSIGEHRYPLDCWRIFPDGMRWLFRDCRQIISCEAFEKDTRIVGLA